MDPGEYAKLAEVEDRMWYFSTVHGIVDAALRRAGITDEAQLLDAGCGTGGLMRRLAGRNWTGVDVSPLACGWARERTDREVAEASLTRLPWADATFSAVTSVDVLYHIEDDRAALRELWRVLRPGGLLITNVPAYRWLWSYHDVATHGVRRYGRQELADKIREAGFAVERLTPWNFLLLPMIVLRRKCWPAPSNRSDVALQTPLVEGLLRGVGRLEQAWLARGGNWPAGSSLFVVARKPE